MSDKKISSKSPDLKPIVLLCAQGELAQIIMNGLADGLPNLIIIQEQKEAKSQVFIRRKHLAGIIPATSILACAFLLRIIGKFSRARHEEIRTEHNLSIAAPKAEHHHVTSVNSPECIALLRKIAPAVIAVYGTRIIKPDVLQSVACPFVNYHAGINPAYRGQNPLYRALCNNDEQHAGFTIHLVDEGVDTGDILYQKQVKVERRDNITTYQLLQMAYALPAFKAVLESIRNGEMKIIATPDLPSRNWLPPSIGEYLYNGIIHRIW